MSEFIKNISKLSSENAVSPRSANLPHDELQHNIETIYNSLSNTYKVGDIAQLLFGNILDLDSNGQRKYINGGKFDTDEKVFSWNAHNGAELSLTNISDDIRDDTGGYTDGVMKMKISRPSTSSGELYSRITRIIQLPPAIKMQKIIIAVKAAAISKFGKYDELPMTVKVNGRKTVVYKVKYDVEQGTVISPVGPHFNEFESVHFGGSVPALSASEVEYIEPSVESGLSQDIYAPLAPYFETVFLTYDLSADENSIELELGYNEDTDSFPDGSLRLFRDGNMTRDGSYFLISNMYVGFNSTGADDSFLNSTFFGEQFSGRFSDINTLYDFENNVAKGSPDFISQYIFSSGDFFVNQTGDVLTGPLDMQDNHILIDSLGDPYNHIYDPNDLAKPLSIFNDVRNIVNVEYVEQLRQDILLGDPASTNPLDNFDAISRALSGDPDFAGTMNRELAGKLSRFGDVSERTMQDAIYMNLNRIEGLDNGRTGNVGVNDAANMLQLSLRLSRENGSSIDDRTIHDDIFMDQFSIQDLSTDALVPLSANSFAVTKEWGIAKYASSSDADRTMNNDLFMGNFGIHDLETCALSGDAANQWYVDNKFNEFFQGVAVIKWRSDEFHTVQVPDPTDLVKDYVMNLGQSLRFDPTTGTDILKDNDIRIGKQDLLLFKDGSLLIEGRHYRVIDDDLTATEGPYSAGSAPDAIPSVTNVTTTWIALIGDEYQDGQVLTAMGINIHDGYLATAGGVMAGEIAMSGRRITALGNPLSPRDAINKASAIALIQAQLGDTHSVAISGFRDENLVLEDSTFGPTTQQEREDNFFVIETTKSFEVGLSTIDVYKDGIKQQQDISPDLTSVDATLNNSGSFFAVHSITPNGVQPLTQIGIVDGAGTRIAADTGSTTNKIAFKPTTWEEGSMVDIHNTVFKFNYLQLEGDTIPNNNMRGAIDMGGYRVYNMPSLSGDDVGTYTNAVRYDEILLRDRYGAHDNQSIDPDTVNTFNFNAVTGTIDYYLSREGQGDKHGRDASNAMPVSLFFSNNDNQFSLDVRNEQTERLCYRVGSTNNIVRVYVDRYVSNGLNQGDFTVGTEKFNFSFGGGGNFEVYLTDSNNDNSQAPAVGNTNGLFTFNQFQIEEGTAVRVITHRRDMESTHDSNVDYAKIRVTGMTNPAQANGDKNISYVKDGSTVIFENAELVFEPESGYANAECYCNVERNSSIVFNANSTLRASDDFISGTSDDNIVVTVSGNSVLEFKDGARIAGSMTRSPNNRDSAMDSATSERIYASGGLTLNINSNASVKLSTTQKDDTSATVFEVSNIYMNKGNLDVEVSNAVITGVIIADHNSVMNLKAYDKIDITTDSFDSSTSVKGWSWIIRGNSNFTFDCVELNGDNVLISLSDSRFLVNTYKGMIKRFVNLLGSVSIFQTDNDGADVSQPSPKFDSLEVHVPPPPFGDGCLVDDDAVMVQKQPYVTKKGWEFVVSGTKVRLFSYPTFIDFDVGVV